MRRLLPRRSLSVLAVVTAAPAVAVALPVVTPAAAQPEPVRPSVHTVAPPPTSARASGQHFDLVGARWSRGTLPPGARLQVQVHADGAWSGWNDLPATDGGPDAGSADAQAAARAGRDGTVHAEPLWVGRADGVRTRVVDAAGQAVATPAGTHLVLVDGGSSPADAGVVRAAPAASAYAGEAQPPIHSRADWGADENVRRSACPEGPDYASTVRVGFVHHTATSNAYSPADVPAIIRSIYAYHVQSNGWCDIGYNFLVDRFGGIWEGRYGGITRAVIGAHTGGFNTESFGVAMIGDFASSAPPAATTDAVARLTAWRLGIANRDPAGHGTLTAGTFSDSHCVVGGRSVSPCPPGTKVTFAAISGHRDADLTDCPGNAGYATLPSLRTKARADLGLGLVDPGVSGSPAGYADGGTVSVVAGLLAGPATWTLRVTDRQTGVPVAVLSGTAGSAIRATWDRRTLGGMLALPGTYDLRLDATSPTDRAAPFTAAVTIRAPAGFAFNRSSGATARWAEAAGNAAGAATTTVAFGSAVGVPLTGDWDGDGVDTPAVVTPAGDTWTWTVAGRTGTQAARFTAGSTACTPVAGDWDGDGRTTPGVACRGATSWQWQLWNTADGSGTPVTVTYGDLAGAPVTGDWDGEGSTGIGTVTAATAGLHWLLSDSTSAPVTAYDVTYGAAGAIPVTGDWDGDGSTGIGAVTPTAGGLSWSLSDAIVSASPGAGFIFGATTDIPVAGRWTSGGAAHVGLVRVGGGGFPPPARTIDDSCPPGEIAPDGFTDVPASSVHAPAIACAVQWKVAQGFSATTYGPTKDVTREQMAGFIARLVRAAGGDLPAATRDYFTDDSRSTFAADINALAAAGVVKGTSATTFAPTAPVLRSQMAAFITRAYDYRAQQAGLPALTGSGDVFPDAHGDVLQAAIDTASAAGLTGGYVDGTYRPNVAVHRDEMASFLARVLDLVVEQHLATVPPAS